MVKSKGQTHELNGQQLSYSWLGAGIPTILTSIGMKY